LTGSKKYKERLLIKLDPPPRKKSKKGTIKIGRSLEFKRTLLFKIPKYKRKHKFFLGEDDIKRHVFISGLTGAGKTNFIKNFLLEFKQKNKINFLIVQIKNEFDFIKNYFDELTFYTPGENYSIDIFNPGDIDPLIHAERIFEMLKNSRLIDASSEFSPQMEKVLVDILTIMCKRKGEKTWQQFNAIFDEYYRNNKNKIPKLEQTIISVKNRIRRFSEGPLKKAFSSKNLVPIEQILNNNSILNLGSIVRLGGDKEDVYFFLMVILKNIWDYNISAGVFDRLKHLTIVDDATYFMPKDSAKGDKISTYLEDIALLQRGTGESLITIATRPDISENILANAGVVIGFSTHFKKRKFAEILNLPEEKNYYLSLLEKGQCIVRTPSIKLPFLLQVPWIKDTNNNSKRVLLSVRKKIHNKLVKIKMNRPIKMNNLPIRLKFLQNCFQSGDYSTCQLLCEEIIDYIVDKLNIRLDYKFGGVKKFISDIEQNGLSSQLKIYSELKKISEIKSVIQNENEMSKENIFELYKQITNILNEFNYVQIDAL